MRIPEIYDPNPGPNFNTWTPLPNLERLQSLYPYMFVLPSGHLVDAGPADTRLLVRVPGFPSMWMWSSFAIADASSPRPDYAGSAAMYEPGKIVRCGGNNPGVATTWTLDLSGDVIPMTWSSAADMNIARRNLNLVVLPDGKLLAVGGNTSDSTVGPVFYPELFDPAIGTWTLQTSSSDPLQKRTYHSTAMLLRDGRVVSAGGDEAYTGQFFKPPYLMVPGAVRTTIVSAPASMQYGQEYMITYNKNGGPAATRACLMRPASVTHGFDQDQHRVPLEIVGPGAIGTMSLNSKLFVRAPANANLAPPGYYMLFIMSQQSGQSVPCTMAAWVQVGP